jgi:hypothetical protein
MRQLQDLLHTAPQASHQTRLTAHNGFSGKHLVNKGHEDRAHFLDNLLETTDALSLSCFGSLAAATEDILGFAVAFATGLAGVSKGL